MAVDPLALRPRFSPGLPLSNDKVSKDFYWKKTASLENIQRQINEAKERGEILRVEITECQDMNKQAQIQIGQKILLLLLPRY